jgi:hypothetical protein
MRWVSLATTPILLAGKRNKGLGRIPVPGSRTFAGENVREQGRPAEGVVLSTLWSFATPIISQAGEAYSARACGRQREDHLWEGWIEYALSNRGRRGRKKDFRDAERLVKRLVANELILSFVPLCPAVLRARPSTTVVLPPVLPKAYAPAYMGFVSSFKTLL